MSGPGEWDEWSRHVLAELKRLDKNHDHTHSKLDRIDDTIQKYNETLIRNTASLEHHVRRTDLLEHKVIQVEKEVNQIKEHVDSFKALMKIVSSLFSLKGRTIIRLAIAAGAALASYKMGIHHFIASLFE